MEEHVSNQETVREFMDSFTAYYAEKMRVPETDEEALQWLEGKPAASRDLYLLYRMPEAFNMDVQTALYETLKACVPSLKVASNE